MPFGTLDRHPPPLFRQGPSARSRLYLYSALALFLMVADARFDFTRPLRAGLATALYPAQWLLLQPIRLVEAARLQLRSVAQLEASERDARERLVAQSAQALLAGQLVEENRQLRQLLALRERVTAPGQVAEVLYLATDPFSRKVIIDRGGLHGVAAGAPVLDDRGVLGQVTRVYPLVSEATLLVDRAQAIPVLNTRTRTRGVAYGLPAAGAGDSGLLELRNLAGTPDVEPGDLLVTSGGDGVYPAGLPVAGVESVERRADAASTRGQARALAQIAGVRYLMVLEPVADVLPPRPDAAAAVARHQDGRAR